MYAAVEGILVQRDSKMGIDQSIVWIDLLNPTKNEDLLIEEILGISIPTREEAQEIEASSRLYAEDDAHFMTAVTLHQTDPPPNGDSKAAKIPMRDYALPKQSPVTFILTRKHVVTVRYEDLRAFHLFLQRSKKKDSACTGPGAVLVGLLETIVDREADRIERITAEVEKLSHTIFDMRGGEASRSRRYDVAIKMIGREAELTSREHESLHSIDRVLTYLSHVLSEREDEKSLRSRIKTASRDLVSLTHHTDALSNKTQFLLDATLGMISTQQNTIIKLFSVASVALMPPTLIASIYGMNFKHMPELEWSYGYPMAIGLMVLSAIVPFVYFKRKGWY
ncbi:MAG: magnesium transporter CorA family protein [Hyphomicrobiaceae bacterium]|nr:magnesium transporter CorA family protein [Hyphomicrobiaceae bacterium]